MRRVLPALLAVVLGVVLAGCQVRVATDVTVAADGSGDVEVALVVDDELRDALEAEGLQLRDGLGEVADAGEWRAEPLDERDATGVRLRASFDEPAQLGVLVDDLTAGLGVEDGALLRDVELLRTEDSGYAFSAMAGLDPPRILGTLPLPGAATGGATDGTAPPVFDGDALGEVLAASDGRHAVAELRLRTPTVPEATDAEVSGTVATWTLPVDGLTAVSATAPPAPVDTNTAVVVAAAAGGLLVGVFAVRALQRRP